MRRNLEARALLAEIVPELDRTEFTLKQTMWAMLTNSTHETKKAHKEAAVAFMVLRSNRQTFLWLERLKRRDNAGEITDPSLVQQIDILYREFAQSQFPESLIQELTAKDAELSGIFNEFRPELDGQKLTENDIGNALAEERNVARRIAVWEASKQIGLKAAPLLVELVKLRNKGAKSLGYENFYDMRLRLDEIDPEWLSLIFRDAQEFSKYSFMSIRTEVDSALLERYGVRPEMLGPWAWTDPFGQEDPLEPNVDAILRGRDILEIVRNYYNSIGLGEDFDDVLSRSDMYERPAKNQHGLTENIGRDGDVRILMNLKPIFWWLDTSMHEFGHAVDFKGIDFSMPWTLRTVSHTMTTETIAMFMGTLTKRNRWLRRTFGSTPDNETLFTELERSGIRARLIFSRFAMVMTRFEEMLYANPRQDLNDWWWTLVENLQQIPRPAKLHGSEWATKMHLSQAPVYYHNYLLADFGVELLRRAVRKALPEGEEDPGLGKFLRDNWFCFGVSKRWDELYRSLSGKPLNPLNPAVWAKYLGKTLGNLDNAKLFLPKDYR